MQRDLVILTLQLVELPAGGDAQAFADACAAVSLRLEAIPRRPTSAKGLELLRALAAQGGAVAKLGQSLAAGAEGNPRWAQILVSIGRVAGRMMYALEALEEAQQSGSGAVGTLPPGLGREQVAGLLCWPLAALRALAATLHCAPLPGTMLFTTGEGIWLLLQHAAERRGWGAPYAGALEEVQAQLPALLRALAWAGGSMAPPGRQQEQEQYSLVAWLCWVQLIQHCLEHSQYTDAVAAGLATEGHASSAAGGSDSSVGAQIAGGLLALLASLADAGPPASTLSPAAAVEAEAAGAEHDGHAALWCWEHLRFVLVRDELAAYMAAHAARRTGDGEQVSASLAAMLQRLQRQLRRSACAAAEGAAEAAEAACAAQARAQLNVVCTAAASINVLLVSHCQTSRCPTLTAAPAPAAAPAGAAAPEAPQALLHAQRQRRSVVEAAWEAVGTLPRVCAVLSAAAAAASPADLEVCGALGILKSLLDNTGAAVMKSLPLGASMPCDPQRAGQLLAGCEAALRCAARLLRSLATQPRLAELAADLLCTAILACMHGLTVGAAWLRAARPQLAAEDGEGVLASAAALACTACKCAVLCTGLVTEAQAGVQAQHPHAAQLAAAVQRAASALPVTFFHCCSLADAAMTQTTTPTERSQR
ncbi:hypothetical protein ABPG75_008211 [Micractinium tetrahymenae]